MIFLKALAKWLPFALTIIVVNGVVYGTMQQTLRSSANDPQIQIAEDAAKALSNGLDPQTIVPETLAVDTEKSLSLTVGVFNEKGEPYGASARLNGKQITPPGGIFEKAKQQGTYTFTWQPTAGVRQAAVVVYYESSTGKGFALVSRSLREVEKRITMNSKIIGLGTAVALILTYILILGLLFVKKYLKNKKNTAPESEFRSSLYSENNSDAVTRSEAETSAEGHIGKE